MRGVAWVSVLCLAAAACERAPAARAVTAAAPGRAPPALVRAAPADEPPRSYPGVLVPRLLADVHSDATGQVVELPVTLGQVVKKGEVLLSVFVAPLQAELAARRAERKLAVATAHKAQLELAHAKKDYQSDATAAAFLSAREMSQSQLAAERARAARTEALAGLELLDARIAELERQIASARVAAPFDAKVSAIYVSVGARVTPETRLLRLVADEHLQVRFAVPAEERSGLAPGSMVKVSMDGTGPAAARQATVIHLSDELDPTSQLLVAEAELMEPGSDSGSLRAGLACEVSPVR